MAKPNDNRSFGEEVELVQGFGLQPTNSFLNIEGELVDVGEGEEGAEAGAANNASDANDEEQADNFIV
jgi:hypothetical protein